MHEAGHAVTAAKLNRWRVSTVAYVAEDARGVAVFPHGLTTHAARVATAAGRWAEKLATRHPPPSRRQRKPLPANKESAEYVRAKALREARTKATESHYNTANESDEKTLAEYCISFDPADPRDWVRRHRRLHAEARLAVRRHAAEIVDMAEELFHEGRAEIAGDEQDENALLEILSKRNKHKPDEPAKTEEYRR